MFLVKDVETNHGKDLKYVTKLQILNLFLGPY